MTPFDAFKMVSAIRLHFTSNYDYFKYHGSVKADASRFETRNDKYYYSKLSRKSETINVELFLASNFLEKEKLWVGDLFGDECKEVYKRHLKTIQSMEYTFKEEVFKHPIDELLTVYDDYDIPLAFKLYKQGEMSVESLVILATVSRTWDYWLKNVSDKIIFPIEVEKLRKYEPFINYGPAKYKALVIDNYSN